MVQQEFDTGSLQHLLKAPEAFRHNNVAYVPVPNQVDVVLSELLGDPALTTTAFVIPFLANGNAIFAQHARRAKLEIPGGHIEPGETMLQAALRELTEETGYRAANLIPIGYQRISSEAEKPDGYKYPFPHSFQQFFVGLVTGNEPYQANEECALPLELTPARAMSRKGPLNRTQTTLFSAGFYKLFENGLITPSLDTILSLPGAARHPAVRHD